MIILNELIFFHFAFRFYEIFIDTPLAVCEKRDVKGLYAKARKGEISGFTGVSQDYEAPQKPDLVVQTVDMEVPQSTNSVIEFLENENVIPKNLRDVAVVSKIAIQFTHLLFNV